MTDDEALLGLLRALDRTGYHFITPTPATHARFLERRSGQAASTLREVFGWNMPFSPQAAPPEILDLLKRSRRLASTEDGFKSKVRASSLGEDLFFHSAFPTEAEDAVFFGPDSYRFARLIRAALPARLPDGAIVDIGTGSGLGAVTAAKLTGRPVLMTDINPKALHLARINATHAGVEARAVEGEGLAGVRGAVALALANPPYIADDAGRDYRDGGGLHGAAVSVAIAREAAGRLATGGRLILYTGAAIVDGRDRLKEALEGVMSEAGCDLDYSEIDPDVFGEELERDAYRDVERIAVVAAVATRR